MVARLDFEVVRGVSKSLPLTFTACRFPCSVDECGRGCLRLRGYTLALEIIKGGLSSEVVDRLSTEDGRIKVDPTRNIVTILFSSETSLKYPRYALPYRVTATYEKGTAFEQVFILLYGEIKIRG